jgi:hypothetical protein
MVGGQREVCQKNERGGVGGQISTDWRETAALPHEYGVGGFGEAKVGNLRKEHLWDDEDRCQQHLR